MFSGAVIGAASGAVLWYVLVKVHQAGYEIFPASPDAHPADIVTFRIPVW